MSDASPRHDPFGFGWPDVISVVPAFALTVFSGLEYFLAMRHRVATS